MTDPREGDIYRNKNGVEVEILRVTPSTIEITDRDSSETLTMKEWIDFQQAGLFYMIRRGRV